MNVENFIKPEQAVELIGRPDVSFVDASWYLPAQGRDGFAEFKSARIPGAVYFDIDQIADTETDLPHMLPTPGQFAREASTLGISHEDLIVIYDGPGLFSAARAWWMFKVMGAEDVRILEGGFDRWKEAGYPIETGNPNPPQVRIFEARFDPEKVAARSDLEKIVESKDAIVIDARPEARFKGSAAEPRPGLRSGHIPGSRSVPFDQLLCDGKLKNSRELEKIFSEAGVEKDTAVITSCGSGVTAAVLSLALAEIEHENNKLYDGSWAEWGKPDGPPVETE